MKFPFDINVHQWQDITKTVPKETRGEVVP